MDLLGLDGSTDEAGCVVGTASEQIVHLAIGIAADEALGDVYLAVGVDLQGLQAAFADVVEVGLGILVCADDVECIEQDGADAGFL